MAVSDEIKPRVMIVEGEFVIGEDLKSRMQSLGYNVCAVFTSSEEALFGAETIKPDIVSMDIRLSEGISGVETARRIYNQWRIPIVFSTAHAEDESLKQAQIAEPFGFIIKPFRDGDIRVALEMALYKSRMDKKRRRAEADLARSEARYRLLAENSTDLIMLCESDGTLKFVSSACKTLLGWLPEELVSRNHFEFCHPEEIIKMRQAQSLLLKGPGEMMVENRFLRKDGTYIWFETSCKSIYSKLDDVLEIQCVSRDVTERKASENKLLESYHLFRAALDNMPVMCCASDEKGTVIFWNGECERVTGWKADEIVGDPGAPPKLIEREQDRRYVFGPRHNNEDILRNFEVEIRRRTGELRIISCSNLQGSELMPAWSNWCVGIDVTEQRRAEKALRKSEDKYRKLVDIAPLGIMSADAEGWITEVNGMFLKILGASSPEDIKGVNLFKHARLISSGIAGDIQKCLEEKQPILKERPFIGSDCRNLWLRYHLTSIPDANGKATGILAIVEDYTELNRAEKELQNSERLYRSIFDNAPVSIFQTTPQGRILSANNEMARFLGYDSPWRLIENVTDIAAQIDVDHGRREQFIQMLEQFGRVDDFERAFRKNDGSITWGSIRAQAIKNQEGETTHYDGFIIDITGNKKAGLLLRESQNQINMIMDQAPVGIFTIDREGNVTDANQKCLQILGSPGLNFTLDLNIFKIPNLVKSGYVEKIKKLLQKGGSQEMDFEYMSFWGKKTFIRARFAPQFNAQGDPIGAITILEDISRRKKAEEALIASEDKFHKAFQTTPQIMIITEIEDGKYLEVNHAFERLTGYPREQVIGRKVNEMAIVFGASLAGGEYRPIGMKSPVHEIEVEYNCRSGEKRDGQLSSRIIFLEDNPCLISIITDITERKNSEKRLKAALLEKDFLLKEIHHRVKNNMQIVMSLLNLQSRKIRSTPVKEAFMESQNRIRAMSLIHQVLYQSDNLAQVDLQQYVTELANDLQRAYGNEGKTIEISIDVGNMKLEIDQAVPCGLIINEIVTNAFRHAFIGCDCGLISISAHLEGSGDVALMISDNGIGIPGNVKPQEADTLGLSLVHGLVEHQLGGILKIESGQGTTFMASFKKGTS